MAERFVTGHKNGRTIYQVQPDGSEVCVGLLDTPDLAREFVDALNARLSAEAIECGWFMTQDEVRRREQAAHAAGRRAGRQEAAQAIRAEADDEALRPERNCCSLKVEKWLREGARIAEGEPDGT